MIIADGQPHIELIWMNDKPLMTDALTHVFTFVGKQCDQYHRQIQE